MRLRGIAVIGGVAVTLAFTAAAAAAVIDGTAGDDILRGGRTRRDPRARRQRRDPWPRGERHPAGGHGRRQCGRRGRRRPRIRRPWKRRRPGERRRRPDLRRFRRGSASRRERSRPHLREPGRRRRLGERRQRRPLRRLGLRPPVRGCRERRAARARRGRRARRPELRAGTGRGLRPTVGAPEHEARGLREALPRREPHPGRGGGRELRRRQRGGRQGQAFTT